MARSTDEESDPLLVRTDDDDLSDHTRASSSRASKRIIIAVFCGLIVLVVATAILAVKDNTGEAPKDDKTPDYVDLPGPKPGLRNPSYFVSGRYGAVATEETRCSDIGVEILKENGTATDAAIAAALCVGVLNSFSSGIGGGGFMVIRPPSCAVAPSSSSPKRFEPCSPPFAIDFREAAPTGAFPKMFAASPKSSKYGGAAAGIPGELRGFEEAYKATGGGVTWERLFEPAAKLADEYQVGAELAKRLPLFGKGWMEEKQEWIDVFLPKGEFAKEGDWIKRTNYAATLRKLGREGANAFYNGSIAESLVATLREEGGTHTTQDFANYRALVTPALVSTYRNRTFYTTAAPSGGSVLINLFNTLEGYDLASTGRTGLQEHRFVEALKFSFARRSEVGDPAFMKEGDLARIEDMQTKDFGRRTRQNISDDKTWGIGHYQPRFDIKEDHGTTHMSVVDQWGSAVSLTTTVNLIFGSRIMDESTGIIINDEMDDFNTPQVPNAFGLRPSPFNYPLPEKRPLSSTSPVIFDAEDGNFWTALGGSGGSRIFGAVAQVILSLDWGYDLGHAIEEPRVHDQLLPAYVSVESGYRVDLLDALKVRGHNITMFDINMGVAEIQGVLRSPSGLLFGASDSRKHGVAASY